MGRALDLVRDRAILPPDAEEVRLDELIDVAVQHGVGVAGLDAGAQVLYQTVRREDVIADLRAERDLHLRRFNLIADGVALPALQLVQAGTQDLPRGVPVR